MKYLGTHSTADTVRVKCHDILQFWPWVFPEDSYKTFSGCHFNANSLYKHIGQDQAAWVFVWDLQKCTSSCLYFLSALLKFAFFSCRTPSSFRDDLSACRLGCSSAATNAQRQKAVSPSSSNSFLMALHLLTHWTLETIFTGKVRREWWNKLCVCVCVSAELVDVNAIVICRLDPPPVCSWLTSLSEPCCIPAIGCFSYQVYH